MSLAMGTERRDGLRDGARRERHRADLEQAFEHVLSANPELQALSFSEQALSSEVAAAKLRPQLSIDAGVENALGTGDANGLRSAELSLSLASVIKRGGKRGARIAVAEQRLAGSQLQREAKRLDLLAEVARRSSRRRGRAGAGESCASRHGAARRYDRSCTSPRSCRRCAPIHRIGCGRGANTRGRRTTTFRTNAPKCCATTQCPVGRCR